MLVLLVFTHETLPIVIRRREGFEMTHLAASAPAHQRVKMALNVSTIRPLRKCGFSFATILTFTA